MKHKANQILARKADSLNSDQLAEACKMVRLASHDDTFYSWATTCAENDCDAEIFETVFGELEPENSPDSSLEIQFRKEAQNWMG